MSTVAPPDLDPSSTEDHPSATTPEPTADRASSPAPRRRPRLAAIVAIAAALVLLAGAIGWLGSREQLSDQGTDQDASSGGTAGAGQSASSSDGADDRSNESTVAPDSASSETSTEDSTTSSGGALSSGAEATEEVAPRDTGRRTAAIEPKVVKTGTIDLVVKPKTFADAERRLRAIAEGAGGYVSASSAASYRREPTGNLTLRVPAQEFDSVVTLVGRLGVVASAESKSQDVTGEFTDLQSRLKAATAERDQVTAILGQASTVGETLQVRDRLNQVQTEIEEMQGRLAVLEDQTSLSTLTVSLRERGTASTVPEKPSEQSGLAKAWDDAVDGFTGGVEAIVAGSGVVLFLALLALVAYGVGRPIWRRAKGAGHPETGDGTA